MRNSSNRRNVPIGAVIAAVTFLLMLAPPAYAEKGGHGKGHGAASGKGHGGGPPAHSNAGGSANGGGKARKFEANDRSAIQSYYRDEYSRSGSCPPGLAKKDNGCMPPGQARRYDVGETIPAGVVLAPIPSALRGRIGPVVSGYDYGYVDGGVVLFSTETRVVVDFVTVY